MEQIGTTFIDKDDYFDYYEINKFLGKGGFGAVYEGKRVNRKNELVEKIAVKEINEKPNYEKEIEFLKNLNHPNIIKFHHQHFDINRQKGYIFMELCDSELKVEQISEKNYLFYFTQMVEGVSYLHDMNVLHRDITPKNILIKGKTIKITDFGISKKLENGDCANTRIGKKSYAAPEIFNNLPYRMGADIFSLGSTLFYFLYKTTPYQVFLEKKLNICNRALEDYSFNISKYVDKFKNFNPFDYEISNFFDIPRKLKDIILDCLNYNPEKRPTIKKLREEMNNLMEKIGEDEAKKNTFICEDENYLYFKEEKKLGKGSYSLVYKGERVKKTNKNKSRKIAVKEIIDKIVFEQEFSLLKNIVHPNILRIYHSFFDEKSQKGYLFLELCDSDFTEKIFSKSDYLSYFIQIAEGLLFLHEKNVIHRDLKPGNILLKKGKIKIADFGNSKLLDTFNLTATLIGTPLFMAPEILNQKKYDYNADIFSLGATFFYFLYKTTPYEYFFLKIKSCKEKINFAFLCQNIKKFKEVNQLDSVAIASSFVIPNEMHKVVIKCLDYDPMSRPKIREIRDQFSLLISKMKNQESLPPEIPLFFPKNDEEIIKRKALNNFANLYRIKYESLVFRHQLSEKLTKLMTDNLIKLKELNTPAIMLFLLVKLKLMKSRYFYRRLRKKENIFEASKEHWESFCEHRNYFLLMNLFDGLKIKSKKEMENLKEIINPILINEDVVTQKKEEILVQKFENKTKGFIENNKNLIEKYDKTNSNSFSQLYFVIYGLIIVISPKENPETPGKEILMYLHGDEKKRKKIYKFINNRLKG